MKSEILAVLRNMEDYVSGQELCERFGVSRTAVWKAINQLKESGYQIEAVQNKGYRLVASPDIMSVSELESIRRTKWVGNKIYYFEEMQGFSRNYNTIHGLLLKLNQLINVGNPQTRDITTIQGALNRL